ncbi:MAG: orotate phosphoribosyltransferase [Nitrococcus sp.]|nr:orotate phosphoribosyltransferase [Nitrococcus sp.]
MITDRQFILSTGQAAGFYFDCKNATLDGSTLILIADEFLAEIDQLPEVPTVIAGLTMGADPIVAAVAMRAAQVGKATNRASIVRKKPKKHGTRNHVENEQQRGSKVVVVDDVITSGSSTHTACKKLMESGYTIVGIICLVDRQAGGVKSLETSIHCPVRSIFTSSDFGRISDASADRSATA